MLRRPHYIALGLLGLLTLIVLNLPSHTAGQLKLTIGSFFLPLFAAAGFLLGLIPFGKLGKALGDLSRSFFPSASTKLVPDHGRIRRRRPVIIAGGKPQRVPAPEFVMSHNGLDDCLR